MRMNILNLIPGAKSKGYDFGSHSSNDPDPTAYDWITNVGRATQSPRTPISMAVVRKQK